MTSMRAAIWHGPNLPQTVEEVALRPVGPAELRVRIGAANACMTDVIDAQPRAFAARAPQIRGHGAVGIVEEIGAQVRIAKPGDRVILAATSFCGRCRFCLSDNASQCVEIMARKQVPCGTLADGREVVCDANLGAFAEQSIISDIQVVPMQTSASDEELAILSIAGAAGAGAALITAPVKPGSTVAVFGCGATGLGYVQGARIAGAARIIAVDPRKHRRDFAMTLGATEALDPAAAPIAEQFRAATPDIGGFQGWGVDYAYEASADPSAVTDAYNVTRSGGHVVLASVPWDFSAQVKLPAIWMGAGGKTIHSSQHGSINILRDFPRFARMIEDGRLNMRGMITARYRLEQINECFEDMHAYREVGCIVLP